MTHSASMRLMDVLDRHMDIDILFLWILQDWKDKHWLSLFEHECLWPCRAPQRPINPSEKRSSLSYLGKEDIIFLKKRKEMINQMGKWTKLLFKIILFTSSIFGSILIYRSNPGWASCNMQNYVKLYLYCSHFPRHYQIRHRMRVSQLLAGGYFTSGKWTLKNSPSDLPKVI